MQTFPSEWVTDVPNCSLQKLKIKISVKLCSDVAQSSKPTNNLADNRMDVGTRLDFFLAYFASCTVF